MYDVGNRRIVEAVESNHAPLGYSVSGPTEHSRSCSSPCSMSNIYYTGVSAGTTLIALDRGKDLPSHGARFLFQRPRPS